MKMTEVFCTGRSYILPYFFIVDLYITLVYRIHLYWCSYSRLELFWLGQQQRLTEPAYPFNPEIIWFGHQSLL